MNLKEAFEIVLDLAGGNVLSDKDVAGDECLRDEQERQEEAIELVRQHVENLGCKST